MNQTVFTSLDLQIRTDQADASQLLTVLVEVVTLDVVFPSGTPGGPEEPGPGELV